MARVVLKGFDDRLLADADYHALGVRHCTRTQFFESAVRRCVEQLDSRAPERAAVVQQAGGNIIDKRKYVQHGDVKIGDINVLSGWKVVVEKLVELPDDFLKGGWGWFVAGFAAAFGYLWLVGMLSL